MLKIVILLLVAIYSLHGHPRPGDGDDTAGDCAGTEWYPIETCEEKRTSSYWRGKIQWNKEGSKLYPGGCLKLEISDATWPDEEFFGNYVDAVYNMAKNIHYNKINKTSKDFKERELKEGIEQDIFKKIRNNQLEYKDDARLYYKLAYKEMKRNLTRGGEQCPEQQFDRCFTPICEPKYSGPAKEGKKLHAYSWTKWGEWSDCNCKKGIRARTRKCTEGGSPDEAHNPNPPKEQDQCKETYTTNGKKGWLENQTDNCQACA